MLYTRYLHKASGCKSRQWRRHVVVPYVEGTYKTTSFTILVPRVAEPWLLLFQAFLNRLHASALATRQAQQGAAAPSQGPSSQDPSLNLSPPAGTEAPVSMPKLPPPADVPSPQLSRTPAESPPWDKQLGVAADHAGSAEEPHGTAVSAALLCQAASPSAGVAPLPGLSPAASQAHPVAAAAGDAPAAAAVTAAVPGSCTCPDGGGVESGSGVAVAGGVVAEVQLSLEWLRSAPPDVAAAYLMSVEGQLVSLQLLLVCSLPCLLVCLLHACMLLRHQSSGENIYTPYNSPAAAAI